MASLTTRINLTGDYAIAVESAARQQGVSQAEIVRIALRAYWGDDLGRAPTNAEQVLHGSPVHPVTRPTVHPPNPLLPGADDLFSHSA